MKPLETGALHPWRTVLYGSGVEEEGGADPDHQGCVQTGDIACHKAVLLGCADAYPNDVWPVPRDLGRELLFFRGGELPVGWCSDPNDPSFGEAGLHSIPQLLRKPFGPSIEEMSAAG